MTGREPPVEHELVDRLTGTLLAVAGALVGDVDVPEMLQLVVDGTVSLLGFTAAGLMLADRQDQLQVAAATSQESGLLELLQAHEGAGPCVEAMRAGCRVAASDVREMAARWPLFAEAAEALGYRAVYSLPLRLGVTPLGSLNLFDAEEHGRTDEQLRVAQALADVAAVSLVQARAVTRNAVLVEQLESALHSRVVIEQAKGVVAEAHGLVMSAAFLRLLRYARDHNLKLSDVAARVVRGDLPPGELGRR